MDCLKTTMVGLDYNMLSAELISVGLSFPLTPSPHMPPTTASGSKPHVLNLCPCMAKSSRIIKYLEGLLQMPQVLANQAILNQVTPLVLHVVDRMKALVDDPGYFSG